MESRLELQQFADSQKASLHLGPGRVRPVQSTWHCASYSAVPGQNLNPLFHLNGRVEESPYRLLARPATLTACPTTHDFTIATNLFGFPIPRPHAGCSLVRGLPGLA